MSYKKGDLIVHPTRKALYLSLDDDCIGHVKEAKALVEDLLHWLNSQGQQLIAEYGPKGESHE